MSGDRERKDGAGTTPVTRASLLSAGCRFFSPGCIAGGAHTDELSLAGLDDGLRLRERSRWEGTSSDTGIVDGDGSDTGLVLRGLILNSSGQKMGLVTVLGHATGAVRGGNSAVGFIEGERLALLVYGAAPIGEIRDDVPAEE